LRGQGRERGLINGIFPRCSYSRAAPHGVAVFAVVFAATRRGSDEAISPRLEALAAAQSEIAGRFAQALAGQTELQTMLAGDLTRSTGVSATVSRKPQAERPKPWAGFRQG